MDATGEVLVVPELMVDPESGRRRVLAVGSDVLFEAAEVAVTRADVADESWRDESIECVEGLLAVPDREVASEDFTTVDHGGRESQAHVAQVNPGELCASVRKWTPEPGVGSSGALSRPARSSAGADQRSLGGRRPVVDR